MDVEEGTARPLLPWSWSLQAWLIEEFYEAMPSLERILLFMFMVVKYTTPTLDLLSIFIFHSNNDDITTASPILTQDVKGMNPH